MIRVDRFSYRYPGARIPALDDISLDIPDGEFLLVAGDSGSGKSTLVSALTGLVPHFHGGEVSGTVTVYGRDTRTHPPRKLADVIGFVAQDPESQSVADGVEDELAFTMENLGLAPVLMRKRMEETLDALAIADLRARRLDSLSGGERQRVAIASVLTAQPRCLVLDEPTSQLDPQSAEDVLGVLHRLNADLGLTIIVVEHRIERVVQYADRVVVMAGGRISADGSPRAVLASGAAATPLSTVARALKWEPLPLTIREGRRFATAIPIRSPQPPAPLETKPQPIVVVRGLRVARAGREVLRGVSLQCAPEEAVAIVGRNGSGKTTLLRALAGLQRAHAGTCTVADFDVAHTPVEQIARRVAYLPQSADAILFCETVREEVAFTLRARGVHGDPNEALRNADLAQFADANPRDLSAGERLRVAMLAATAGDPDVVLLDEPTRGMDATGKDRLVRDLASWRARGRAIILVTHDVELVARAAGRVVLLSAGEVVVDGPVRDVLGESALFSSQMNKVFSDRRVLTVEDALALVGAR